MAPATGVVPTSKPSAAAEFAHWSAFPQNGPAHGARFLTPHVHCPHGYVFAVGSSDTEPNEEGETCPLVAVCLAV